MSTITCPNSDCDNKITDNINYCPFCGIELKNYLPATPELINIAHNWVENPRVFIKIHLGISSLYHLNKIWDAVRYGRCSLIELLTFNKNELIDKAKIGKKSADTLIEARTNWNLSE